MVRERVVREHILWQEKVFAEWRMSRSLGKTLVVKTLVVKTLVVKTLVVREGVCRMEDEH